MRGCNHVRDAGGAALKHKLVGIRGGLHAWSVCGEGLSEDIHDFLAVV